MLSLLVIKRCYNAWLKVRKKSTIYAIVLNPNSRIEFVFKTTSMRFTDISVFQKPRLYKSRRLQFSKLESSFLFLCCINS